MKGHCTATALVTVLAAALSVPLSLGAAQRRTQLDKYATAHQLFVALYPTLVSERTFFAITGDEGVPLYVTEPRLSRFRASVLAERYGKEIQRGDFEFDYDGKLIAMSMGETAWLNGDRRREVDKKMSGSDYNDDFFAPMLRTVGLKYGPDSRADVIELAKSTLERLEPLLGKATISGADFYPRSMLTWTVEVRVVLNGVTSYYSVLFEAFEGKPVGIARHEARK